MTTMSIEDVTSRVSAIQAQLASMFSATTATTGSTGSTSTTASTSSTSGGDFSTALGRAMTGGTGSSTTGQQAVADAQKYLGVPYVWGGTNPATGLDCSGLTQLAYKDVGVSLPRTAAEQQQVGTPVASMADAQPGDLLFYGSPAHHVVIYAGDGKIIEAPHTGEDVREVPLSYDGTPTSIRRIAGSSLDPNASTASTTSTGSASQVSGSTPYAADFAAASARTGVPVSMLTAVAEQESGFQADAVSKAGAEGIMQLMPGTAKSLGVTNPMDPAQSINGAADYLKTMLDRFGSTSLALAAYNAGPGAVLKYDGIPPYPETQNYVKDVLATMGGAS